jgi:polyisoprenoid-binding protein YceI
MKKWIYCVWLLGISGFCSGQLKPLQDGSSVQFKIKNFGFNTGGTFSGLKGSIVFDANNLMAANFDITIDASSVNTDNSMRDDHLREESYFDVKNYPQIHFVSSKVTKSNKNGVFFVSGKLTIKKQTKDISFPFTADAQADGYLFKGNFKINRRDFDVGGSSTISDELEVILSVLAKKGQ